MRALPALLALLLAAGSAFAQESTPAPPTDTAKAEGEATPAAAETPAETTDAAPAEAAPAATEAGPTESPAVVNGTLSVTSEPSGTVFIDDKDTGLTTPVADLPVEPGKHTLKVVAADGRSQSSEFTMEAGGSLSLNLSLPAAESAEPAKTEEPKAEDGATDASATPAAEAAPPPADWSWMTVTGWSGLGLGTIGLLSGAVVLTTPTDPQQGPLGFGLFGAGVGMVLGGAVLLYLDNELSEEPAAEPAAAAAAR